MTKTITYPNPDLKDFECTQLSEDKTSAVTQFKVINTTDFEADQYIVIEQVGNEIAEQNQIDTITDLETINLKTTTGFAHGKLTPIKRTPYNKIRLHRSADGETYSQIDEKDIDWQDKYNQAVFIDPTGTDEYYYKIEYYNSTTSLSWFSSQIKIPTQIGYLTVEEFQRETGIKGNPETIAHALKYGAQMIFRKLYTHRLALSTAEQTQFKLDVGQDCGGMGALEFADGNLDGKIDKEDFLAYEVDQDGVRTYVTSDITSIDVDRHLVTFGSTHPTNGRTLNIEYDLTFRKLAELDEAVRRLNLLHAVNYLFRNIPMRRMQRGVGSWSLNGVSIDFDGAELREIITSNNTEINGIVSDIQRIYIRFTNLRRPERKNYGYLRSTLHWTSN